MTRSCISHHGVVTTHMATGIKRHAHHKRALHQVASGLLLLGPGHGTFSPEPVAFQPAMKSKKGKSKTFKLKF